MAPISRIASAASTADPYIDSSLQLLLAAGYFRARIKKLSAYDRIVGGLVWCIGLVGEDVSIGVDLGEIYVEEANIGHKIYITEQICAALKQLNCPQLLQPQQIVKLVEVKPIYQVLQWLVKKVFQHREENEERIRQYSEFAAKAYTTQQGTDGSAATPTPVPTSSSQRADNQYLQWSEYLPKRKYKRKDALNIPNEEWTHAKLVMLEYGREFLNFKAPTGAQKKNSTSKDTQQFSLTRQKLDAHFHMHQREQASMSRANEASSAEDLQRELEEDTGRINRAAIGSMMELDEIQQAREKHLRNEQELERIKLEQGNSDEFLHKRKMASLHKQVDIKKQEALELKQRRDSLSARYNAAKEENDKYTNFNTKISEKLNDMKQVIADENLSPEDRAILRKLQQLVKLNESLKLQEQQFRAQCKQQLTELKQLIADLEKQKKSKEFAALVEVEKQLGLEDEKLRKVRTLLAKKNRELLVIQRKIDEIPVRSEVSQYESRFEELYGETVSKLDETRKYYDQFNTLSDTHAFMQKELTLLTQIHDFFEKSTKTKNKEYKPWMQKTVANLVVGVKKSHEAVEQQMRAEQQKRDEVQKRYNGLMAQQREYFRKIKDFEKEANKSGELRKALGKVTAMLKGAKKGIQEKES